MILNMFEVDSFQIDTTNGAVVHGAIINHTVGQVCGDGPLGCAG